MTTSKQARDAKRAPTVLELRAQGYSMRDIGSALGLQIKEVTRMLDEEMEEQRKLTQATADYNLEISLLRLEDVVQRSFAVTNGIQDAAKAGDPTAAAAVAKSLDTVLKAEDRKSKLLGLDKARGLNVQVTETQMAQEAVMNKLLGEVK